MKEDGSMDSGKELAFLFIHLEIALKDFGKKMLDRVQVS